MKKIEILKLGQIVTDKFTQTSGMLMCFNTDTMGNELYLFQPKIISPKTLAPVGTFWLTEDRLGKVEKEEVELPTELLGTLVVDEATGFKGSAMDITYHLNGCVHVSIKASGIVPETGHTIDTYEADFRRLSGEFVPKMTEIEKKADRIKKPSPIFTPSKSVR